MIPIHSFYSAYLLNDTYNCYEALILSFSSFGAFADYITDRSSPWGSVGTDVHKGREITAYKPRFPAFLLILLSLPTIITCSAMDFDEGMPINMWTVTAPIVPNRLTQIVVPIVSNCKTENTPSVHDLVFPREPVNAVSESISYLIYYNLFTYPFTVEHTRTSIEQIQ